MSIQAKPLPKNAARSVLHRMRKARPKSDFELVNVVGVDKTSGQPMTIGHYIRESVHEEYRTHRLSERKIVLRGAAVQMHGIEQARHIPRAPRKRA